MAFELVPADIVVLNDKSVAVHEAQTFGEDVLRVQVLRHLNSILYNHLLIIFSFFSQSIARLTSIYMFLMMLTFDYSLYIIMGIIRSSAETAIALSSQKFPDVNYLEASVCGWQHYMEDYTGHAKLTENVSVFYVLDGHGGPDVAELAAQLIPEILKKSELTSLDQYKSAVEGLFPALDDALKKQTARCSAIRLKHGLPALIERWPTSGCSLVVAVVGANEVVIANVGECKAYVCYSSNPSKAVLISGNHSENNRDDEARVKNAGGFFSGGRVNGLFPFTRSLGDYGLKDNEFLSKQQQLLVCTPSVFALRKQDVRMVVLGSSGLWERTNLALKQLTSDDLELAELQKRARGLLETLVSKNPREGDLGLKNIALLAIDVKN